MAKERSRGAEYIICELIKKSFSARTVGEQKEILQHKKPRPKLGPRIANRQFQDGWYAKKEWLCGSTNLQRLCYWPCLSFAPGKSQMWTRQGYADMRCFLSDCRKYGRSNCHLEAYEKCVLLECFAKYDSVFERRLHIELTEGEMIHSGVFTGVYSEVQNVLIECIDSVIQDQIDKEIENCRFLSIQVDETTDVSTKEQISVIFVWIGKVK